MRGRQALVGGLAVLAVSLAGCGGPTPAAFPSGGPLVHLSSQRALPGGREGTVNTAQPSSIACTLAGSCVYWGTLDLPSDSYEVAPGQFPPPTSVGLWNDGGRTWHPMRMPDGTYADIGLQGCTATLCLLAGAASGHDAVWRYDGAAHSVVVVSHPSTGTGVTAISCWGTASCAIADVGRHSRARFFLTSDGGRTWRVDRTLTAIPRRPRYLSIEQLTCWSSTECLVANSYEDPPNSHGPSEDAYTEVFLTGAHRIVAEQPFFQPALAALVCRSRTTCLLVTEDDDYAGYWLQQHLYVSRDGGRRWTYVKSPLGKVMMLAPNDNVTYDLSCATSGCLAVVSMRSSPAALLRFDDDRWSLVRTAPASGGFDSVACGETRCAAVGDWSAAILSP